MRTNILDLPTEIIQHIASYLNEYVVSFMASHWYFNDILNNGSKSLVSKYAIDSSMISQLGMFETLDVCINSTILEDNTMILPKKIKQFILKTDNTCHIIHIIIEDNTMEKLKLMSINCASKLFINTPLVNLTKLNIQSDIKLTDLSKYLPNLTKLNTVVGYNNHEDVIRILKKCSKITSLNLCFEYSKHDIMGHISSMTNLTKLQLTNSDYYYGTYDFSISFSSLGVDTFTKLTKLEKLTLLHLKIDTNYPVDFSLPSLKTLIIKTSITNWNSLSINEFECPNIQTLILPENVIFTDNINSNHKWNKLRELSIRCTENVPLIRCTDNVPHSVSSFRNITYLTLFNPTYNDNLISMLKELENVRYIKLSMISMITNELISIINGFSNVYYVNVSSTNMSYDVIERPRINVDKLKMGSFKASKSIELINQKKLKQCLINKLNDVKKLRDLERILNEYGISSFKYTFINAYRQYSSFSQFDLIDSTLYMEDCYIFSLCFNCPFIQIIYLNVYIAEDDYEYKIVSIKMDKSNKNEYLNKTIQTTIINKDDKKRIENGDFKVLIENGFELIDCYIDYTSSPIVRHINFLVYAKYYAWRKDNSIVYVYYDDDKFNVINRII